MKIGIIGYGFVGNALASSFNDSVDYRIVDPKKNTTISSLVEFSPEIVFICVPTPMNDDGSQDDSILKDVFKEINDNKIKATIVIKSTILPSFFENIKSNNIVYNPEFLTEANAEQDFINSDFIILGGIDQIAIDKIENFYKKHTLCLSKKYAKTDFITASFLKYAINNYLAHKVVFFNQLFDLFQKSGTNKSWSELLKLIELDQRIGSSHMNVPGNDNRKGYGGACFPKDANAFLHYSLSLNSPLKLIEKSIEINNKIRSSYSTITAREKVQNINFKKK